MDWSHGTYTLQPNGSITTIPFGDGFMQVQDACAAVSNFIQPYNQTEYMPQWNIFLDSLKRSPGFMKVTFRSQPHSPQAMGR